MLKKFVFLLALMAVFAVAVSAQTGNSEVFVFDLNTKNGQISVSNPKNVSNSPGYDNQPSFSYDGNSVLFTSIRNDAPPDIYEFDLKKEKLSRLTNTPESEYTPRERKKGTVTFVREGLDQTMSVFGMDRKSGKIGMALKNKEPVAYYDWNSKGGAFVWVRYAFVGRFVDPENGKNDFVTDNMIPSAPQNIPGTDSFSFVYRRPDGSQWIKIYDPADKSVRPLTPIKDGSIDYCWTVDRTIVTGVGSELYSYREGGQWQKGSDLKELGIKSITRMAVSPGGDKIVLVGEL